VQPPRRIEILASSLTLHLGITYILTHGTVQHLFIDFEKTSDSVTRELLYTTLIEFGIPMELVRLIKMRFNEICSDFCTGRNLSDAFLI